jgi:UPF0271 protein
LIRFDEAVSGGILKLRVPKEGYVEKAREAAMKVGDYKFLSDVDIQLLALASELKSEGYDPAILTDDYSIQNVAREMGVKFSPLATAGIRSEVRWVVYCPACFRRYPPDYRYDVCEICGTELRRKAR